MRRRLRAVRSLLSGLRRRTYATLTAGDLLIADVIGKHPDIYDAWIEVCEMVVDAHGNGHGSDLPDTADSGFRRLVYLSRWRDHAPAARDTFPGKVRRAYRYDAPLRFV